MLFEEGLAIGCRFVGPMEVNDILLFHLPGIKSGHVVDDGREVDDTVVGGAKNNPELFELTDVIF